LGDTIQRQTSTRPEPGSFRDWDGRVFASDDVVLRSLSAQGLADWRRLASTELFGRLVEAGELIGTSPADESELDDVRRIDPDGAWAGALRHERVPFVSYPYEWTFSMLQDAARLQLRLTAEALQEGLMLKDASPYNVQWRGVRPVFIDIGSFESLRPGEPWPGYRQFCMLYLYPLLLEAYRGLTFQSWLRGSPDGIRPEEFRALFARRDALRRGMLRHVFLLASLEGRNAGRGAEVRGELAAAGFDVRFVSANVERLAKLVDRLRSSTQRSAWEDYRSTCTYDEGDIAAKEDFVARVVGRTTRRLVWDLGCNDGRFSEIASTCSDLTLAIDSDPAVIDTIYRSLRAREGASILPLVMDVANPSPALGWRNSERATLVERGAPQLVLCLALVHHLSIAGNVPLREIVDWLRSFDCEVVVEFPHRDDPMVQRLIGAKRIGAHPDYYEETFAQLLRDACGVIDSVVLPSGKRTLYLMTPP
jgi:hypothetical protein